MVRIAINGFGRIGRGMLRAWLAREELGQAIEVVAVNDLMPAETLAWLLRADSVYGMLGEPVSVEGDDVLRVAGHEITLLAERDPAKLPWRDLDIDVVLESTGFFTKAEAARAHLRAGAQHVLVSAPSKGADATIVMGVNDETLRGRQATIVSNGSCTTNAIAPIARVLHDLATIEQGMMTTVHAYTGDQMLVDGPHSDLRRARAAGLNLVPTSTGAARAIGSVIPELDGKLSGDAIRVPVASGSLIELTAHVSREVSVEEVVAAYAEAEQARLEGILAVSHDPLVSSDIVGDPHSVVIDAGLVRQVGNHVKVVGWYDNEWGFSNRMLETALAIAEVAKNGA
ncbi:type I glyceraldehyde-3-phosphate dehydrogenase [Leucobacter chinensis]|uniref:type I glyceraldehyde-3-phosphate dehydrogenase n=1 Tax=Leucobacter chinensis TaxID=2851010 RepID=UPI001C214F24|nr:type I glyceraldehyde-3-phosphate dehydrogenase [Leucobacter chinensis]